MCTPGEATEIVCAYVVGCDGGRSTVRQQIGAELHGDPIVQRVQSTCLRAPSLPGLMHPGPSWATCALNPRRSGTMYAIDGREIWLIHNYRSLYDALGPDFTLLRLDPAIDPTPLLHAAARRRVPLTLVDVDAADAHLHYPRRLVLSRPDQHVAWRGDRMPDDPIALIDLVRGAAVQVAS